MAMLNEMLSTLALPPYLPKDATPAAWPAIRARIIRMLQEQEYGVVPDVPCRVEAKTLQETDSFCAGKCRLQNVELTLTLPHGSCAFPAFLAMPAAPGPHPLFVYISFQSDVPCEYLPSEEICDRGYAVLSLDYNAVSPDRDDGFADGLARLLRQSAADAGVVPEMLPGKIAVWAFAMSRALDWALAQPGVDPAKTACIGHSRLGKTALLCGLLDERFACAISNDSGCSGAAITRGKPGERIADITGHFPFWFCENYRQYASREEALPFEQDALLAGIAPRLLQVGSAQEDIWAGPSHEYLSCVSASQAWKLLGKPGFVHPDRLPVPGDALNDGSVGYHLRLGKHYLSREDWNRYMDFLDQKGWGAQGR